MSPAVRPARAPAAPRAPGAATGAAVELRLVLNAGWVAPSIARERVEAWLRAHQWPPAQVDELVLVVSNSVEHGYRVPIDSIDHPGSVETGASTRGHGMLIMRSCTDELVVEGSATGTTVLVRSRPAPPIP